MEIQEREQILQHHRHKNPKGSFLGSVSTPMHWFRKLHSELHWSFLVAVLIVYGINQGLGMGLSRVSVQYYMKDDRKLEPSEAQVYFGIIQIPWIVKPLWGLLTDTIPICGFRRRPYFLLSGCLTIVSMLLLSLGENVPLASALSCLVISSVGVAIADVTVDACVTENSIAHPSLTGYMQSLCWFCSSIGALVGFSLSGFLIHLMGSKGVFGILTIPATLIILTGILLRESPAQNFVHRRVDEKFLDAAKLTWMTLKHPEVWRPCLYMYMSLALSLNIREGVFYWFTDAEDGPKFSQEIVGSIFSFGAIGSLLGVLVYQNFLISHSLRATLFWAQLLFGIAGLLDLVLVLRLNLKFYVPDYLFVVMDDIVSIFIIRIKWMPLLVLSSKLCPSGIEGTFFALLMSIDHLGLLSSSWTGGILLHMLKVTRMQFDNLWMAILIRSLFRIVPIGLLFLIPGSDPSLISLPSELLKAKKGDDVCEPETHEMAPLINGA
ncbi:hypothetical protein SAY87_012301 [Trapa incisa]|uniref:Folate-biopterin transporter 3 n=1 Tax=Trapa incisa TaxID=236973 RepID=A0AAN7JIS3_9MYRT|nr:hypothetical protein SAY87_012301 [Trapa incisa]